MGTSCNNFRKENCQSRFWRTQSLRVCVQCKLWLFLEHLPTNTHTQVSSNPAERKVFKLVLNCMCFILSIASHDTVTKHFHHCVVNSTLDGHLTLLLPVLVRVKIWQKGFTRFYKLFICVQSYIRYNIFGRGRYLQERAFVENGHGRGGGGHSAKMLQTFVG